MLRQHHIASVAVSSKIMPVSQEVTADFVYVRFHRLKDGPAHNYTDHEMQPWAKNTPRMRRSRAYRICLLQQRHEHPRTRKRRTPYDPDWSFGSRTAGSGNF